MQTDGTQNIQSHTANIAKPGRRNRQSDKATSWTTQESPFRLPAEATDLSLFQNVQTSPWSHPASCSKVLGAHSAEIKRPEGETTHPPPSTVDVNRNWCYKFRTLYAFMVSRGIRLTCVYLEPTRSYTIFTATYDGPACKKIPFTITNSRGNAHTEQKTLPTSIIITVKDLGRIAPWFICSVVFIIGSKYLQNTINRN